MNQYGKLLSSIALRVVKTGAVSVSPAGTCRIHNFVRPTRYVLTRRKKREAEKYPERARPQPRSGFVEWNFQAEIYAFGKRLNEEFDEALFKEALIDKSYVHKQRLRQEELGIESDAVTDPKDNSELAEHGIQILKSTLTAFINKEFPRLPAEGVESVVNNLTSVPVLAKISSLVGTKDLIQSSEYPPTEEAFAKSFQAIVGVLEKTSGRERTEKFVVDFVASYLCGKDVNDFWNISEPWHMLMDINKQRGGGSLEPRILREAGKNTLLSAYMVGIYNETKTLIGTGIGETIDIAQEMAARDVLKTVFGTRDPRAPYEFQTSNYPLKLIPHVRNP